MSFRERETPSCGGRGDELLKKKKNFVRLRFKPIFEYICIGKKNSTKIIERYTPQWPCRIVGYRISAVP